MDGLWIIILESLLALALLVFIVWWTMPKKDRRSARSSRSRDAETAKDGTQRP